MKDNSIEIPRLKNKITWGSCKNESGFILWGKSNDRLVFMNYGKIKKFLFGHGFARRKISKALKTPPELVCKIMEPKIDELNIQRVNDRLLDFIFANFYKKKICNHLCNVGTCPFKNKTAINSACRIRISEVNGIKYIKGI